MNFNFKQIVIVEQIVGEATLSTWNLNTDYANHVAQLEAFEIPKEIYDETELTGTSQYTTKNRHGDKIVYTLIRSVKND